MTTSNTESDVRGRAEGVVQVVIMLAVAAMAGAASFRHVHDWTMHNSPAGTGDWFGWANAMVSELIPLAAGLEARRRHRLYGKAGVYPIALILGAVALSLTGQFAEAKPGLSGWVISAVPALGFLALVKLVLSSPPQAGTDHTSNDHVDDIPVEPTPDTALEQAIDPAQTGVAVQPDATDINRLVPLARFATVQHEQTTGRPITTGELATRLSVTPVIAGQLLTELGQPTGSIPTTITTDPTRINGHPVLPGGDSR